MDATGIRHARSVLAHMRYSSFFLQIWSMHAAHRHAAMLSYGSCSYDFCYCRGLLSIWYEGLLTCLEQLRWLCLQVCMYAVHMLIIAMEAVIVQSGLSHEAQGIGKGGRFVCVH